mgnify:CR=1 FL=1|jgi:hypothetical protein
MSKVKIRSLEGVEEYAATRPYACETCCRLIQVGDPTLLVAYLTDPPFLTGLKELDDESEEMGSNLFHHHCEDCGEIFRIKHNV